VLTVIGIFLAGLLLLYAGGESLVRGAASLGLHWGIKPLVVGLTIVAFATSAPELLVSLQASLQGETGLAVGNVVGSNICNISLILGITTLVRPTRVDVKLVRLDVPVMLVGRVHDPETAESILAAGHADLIAMARPLLADPYLPAKVMRSLPEQIRRCISCENCIDTMQTQDNLACAINPYSGREDALPQPSRSRKVVVVGGGTAGLEAARLAAEAGHEVILLERQRRLGGSLVLAATGFRSFHSGAHHNSSPECRVDRPESAGQRRPW